MRRTKVMVVFGSPSDVSEMSHVVRELQKHPSEFHIVVVVAGSLCDSLAQGLSELGIHTNWDLSYAEEKTMLFPVTVKVMNAIHQLLEQDKPELLLVHGRTTPVMSAAIAAYYEQIAVGHIGAGIRTHGKYSPFPEEMNGKLLASLADIHFAPTEEAKGNLLAEGVSEKDVHVVGDMGENEEVVQEIVRVLQLWREHS